MTPAAWLTAVVVVGAVGVLAWGRWGPDLVLMGALTLLAAAGVVTPREAFAGFGNETVVAIAALFVVAAGLWETGASQRAVELVLGHERRLRPALVRMTLSVAAISAFVNNTPVVVASLPVVRDWARRVGVAPSKLLIPLSYAAILGGTTTLIGTSTNLVVAAILVAHGGPRLGLCEPALIGVPVTVVGLLYLWFLGPRLLPERPDPRQVAADPREYTVEMVVAPDSPLVGKRIEEAGLRHLPHGYLMEIHRGDEVLAAVGPDTRLQAGDGLVFVGAIDTVVDLQRFQGLHPAPSQLFKLDGPRNQRILVEAVVAPACPLVGQTIREGRFRTLYGGVVVAVSRHGERIRGKIGDIVLQPGDTLLIEALPSFLERVRASRDFYLVSPIPEATPPRHDRLPIAVAILVAMVALVAVAGVPLAVAALGAAGAMLLSGCVSERGARAAIDWRLLIVIGAAMGLGEAVAKTGIAATAAGGILAAAGGHPLVALFLLYLATNLLTEFVTNSAAAVLVLPLALELAAALGVSVTPFAVTVMLAASASFATPIGYQTNLLVFGAGGYRFADFLRVGLPLTLLVGTLATLVVPRWWPF